MSGQPPRLVPVQALRLIAAMLVMLAHSELFGYHLGRYLGMTLPRTALLDRGGFGVDLFFAISGFVMVLSSRRLYGTAHGRRVFLARRFARIVPLYWCALLASLAWQLRFEHAGLDAGALARSLLFIPYRNAAGHVAPLLETGWTLNYEMLFYLVFAAALAADAGRTVRRVAWVLAVLVGLRLIIVPPLPVAAWMRPLVLEFAGGMGLALLMLREVRLHGALRLALLAAATVLVAAGDFGQQQDFAGWSRIASFGFAGCAVLAAATLGPLRLPAPRFWMLGGDISYALYLCHMPIQSAAQFIWRHYHWAYGPAREWLFVGVVSGLCLLAALAIHIGFERPMTAWLNARLVSGRAGP